MKKPTTTRSKAKPTRDVKPTTPKPKAKPRTPAPVKEDRTPDPHAGDALNVGETLAVLFHRHAKEEKPTKPRRRPGVPFNLKILYPKQPELRKAIFSGEGVRKAFRDHLINAGLFTLHEDGGSLVLPKPLQRHQRGGYCDHPETLLNDLAEILADFFTHEVETKGISSAKLEIEIGLSVGIIAGSRQIFLESGVPGKSFDATVKCLKRWTKRIATVKADRTGKTLIEDLRAMLFLSYKNLSRLPELQIFASVGRLLKSLGLEPGTEKDIANRLKTAINERRKKDPKGFARLSPFQSTYPNFFEAPNSTTG
jgi:hypothetical protein